MCVFIFYHRSLCSETGWEGAKTGSRDGEEHHGPGSLPLRWSNAPDGKREDLATV